MSEDDVFGISDYPDDMKDSEITAIADEGVLQRMNGLVDDVSWLFDKVKQQENISVDDFIKASEQLRKTVGQLSTFLYQQERLKQWRDKSEADKNYNKEATLSDIADLMGGHKLKADLLDRVLGGTLSVEDARIKLKEGGLRNG